MEILYIVSAGLVLVTFIYLLIMGWFTVPLFRKPGNDMDGTDIPFISVILAVRNEEANIRSCLESLLVQDYPQEKFEIIVSDDQSTDGTKEIAIATGLKHPVVRLTFLEADSAGGEGKKSAILHAIPAAAGDLIATTDGDTLRGTGWLRAMAQEYCASRVKMVLGPVRLEATSFFEKIQQVEFAGIMGLTAGSAARRLPLMANGANLLYEKKAFWEAGGFSATLHLPSGDDQFLLAAFQKKFGKSAASFAFRRDAIVTTAAESTLTGFFHQRMRWVSKSKGYRDPAVMLTGMLTWLTLTSILASFLVSLIVPNILNITLLCLGAKMVADLPMVVKMTRFFGLGKGLWLFVPAQLFQLVYVPFTGLAGLLFSYRWKGRLIKA